MRNIQINNVTPAERTFPSFAYNEVGEIFMVHRTHSGKDAVTWAQAMGEDGERVRFDPEIHVMFAVGTTITLTV